MSTARVVSADKSESPAALLRSALPNLLFGLLVIYNTLRFFRHAMWRDELQPFMITVTSATPLEVLARVKYEGHPALWYLLLWVITRFTSGPETATAAPSLMARGSYPNWSSSCSSTSRTPSWAMRLMWSIA
jgi:hypothetical protein